MPFSPELTTLAYVTTPDRARVLLVHRVARESDEQLGKYNGLGGKVEPGEDIVAAMRRELREEAGIEVADVRYFGSQPWPFTNSLMVGFTARWASGEIVEDPEEIAEAGWFAPDALPVVPPKLSIARALIDDFVRRAG